MLRSATQKNRQTRIVKFMHTHTHIHREKERERKRQRNIYRERPNTNKRQTHTTNDDLICVVDANIIIPPEKMSRLRNSKLIEQYACPQRLQHFSDTIVSYYLRLF